MPLKSYFLGCLIVMMGACSSAALKIYPQLQHYNGDTEFTSFICSNDNDSYVSADDVEWLYPNFTIMTSTLDYRIDVYGDFVTFSPPLSIDAGSYWCRRKTNHSDMAEGKLMFKGTPELIAEQDEEVTVSIGEEVTLNCTVSASPDPVYSWLFPDSCSSCPNTSNNSVLIFTAEDITDSGEYICVAENKYGNLSVTFYITVIIPPTFVFSNDLVLFEERITLLGSDIFINCSVNYGTEYNTTSWLFDYEPLLINQTSKYSQNTSGLTIYNVTESNEGYYICYVGEIWAFILLQIARPPELVSKQNQTVTVNVNEEVTLNCSVSSVPDPVYSWSFPESCSSCSNTSNNSVLVFTAENVNNSGEYTCVAENKYGNLSVTFQVTVTLVDCGVPETPTNGIVKFDSTAKGSIATYECNEGCILNGAVQRVCENTGQWSCNVPRCKTLAPDIITHPTNTTAAAPFSATLTCSAKGCGKLNVIWHRHAKPLPQKAYSTMTTSANGTISTLTIPNVSITDTGRYYCVVWARKKATQSGEVHLFLSDPPLRPVVSVTPITNLTHNNFNLTMKCVPHSNHFHYIYTWIKKDDVLPSRAQGVNSPYLTIINLRPKDSGDYQCIVSNSTGRIASEFATVKIIVSLPRITEQPDDVNVTTACNSASFLCTASGFGSLKIAWKRINYTLPITADVTEQKSLNELSSTLTISEIVGYYSGQYYCVAENEVGKISSQIVNLHVKTIHHPEMILPLENITVLPYQDCKLNCLALSSGVLTYEWSKRGGNLPQSAVKSYIHETFFNSHGGETTLVYGLAIPFVQLSDEGWYCCVATNEAGSTTACAWLEVNALPNITLQPAPVTFKAGDQNVVAMYCKAITHGVTPIYYQWERYHSLSNSWIRPSQRAVNITSPQLEFSIIMEEDEGAYRCIADNDDGSVTSENATIFVYGPPNIVLITNHTVSMEGDKVNLLCIINNDAHANYSLQISWYKDNKLIIPNGNHISLRNEGSRQLKSTLILDSVIPTDDGVYTCRAYNHPDLYAESKTNLTVEYAPRVSIVNPSPYMINVGSLGILYCRASGKPVPMVQWYKNGFPVNRIASVFQQALLIPNNTQRTTVYTCEGKNYAGSKKHMGFANITVILRDLQPCRPLLEAPENGERHIIEIDGFAKHISFSCNSNYALMGKSLATCNNGTWSTSTPTCK